MVKHMSDTAYMSHSYRVLYTSRALSFSGETPTDETVSSAIGEFIQLERELEREDWMVMIFMPLSQEGCITFEVLVRISDDRDAEERRDTLLKRFEAYLDERLGMIIPDRSLLGIKDMTIETEMVRALSNSNR